jgi:hypothetical protein
MARHDAPLALAIYAYPELWRMSHQQINLILESDSRAPEVYAGKFSHFCHWHM